MYSLAWYVRMAMLVYDKIHIIYYILKLYRSTYIIYSQILSYTGEIDLSQPDYYLASSNIFDIAIRCNLWVPNTVPFHFTHVYGNDRIKTAFMSTRRLW